jgi:hypothetical protein
MGHSKLLTDKESIKLGDIFILIFIYDFSEKVNNVQNLRNAGPSERL